MSNVNTYRVIDFIMPFLPEPVGDSMVLAQRHLNELVAAYDALAPDWANAPEWAQWYAIYADGAGAWYEAAPNVILSSGVWNAPGHELYVPVSDLFPEGIDWRLCKWQRLEVTK